MDQFDSLQTGKGLLQDAYPTSPVGLALKKKREKMREKLKEKAIKKPK